MRYKKVGSHTFRFVGIDELRDVDAEPGRWDDLRLTTGWHSLDLASEGGLPRNGLITVSGASDEQLRSFVFALVGHRQRLNRPVAVVDMVSDFTEHNLGHTAVDFQQLTVVSTDKIEEAVEATRRLMSDSRLDFVLLHAPQLDKLIHRQRPELEKFLYAVLQSALRSAAAAVVNVGEAEPPLELATADSVYLRLKQDHMVTIDTGLDRTDMTVSTTEDARPALYPDLVSGGLVANLVTNVGGTFRYGTLKANSRRLFEQILEADIVAAQSLERRLQEETEKLQRAAEPGFDINTWFEAAEHPVLPLRVGQPYALCLRIGAPEQHPGVSVQSLADIPDFGDNDSISLVASLYGADFAADIRNKIFVLHRHGSSDLVTFAMRPLHTGVCNVQIAISTANELELLHELELEVDVQGTLRTEEAVR